MSSDQSTHGDAPRDPVEITRSIREAPTFEEALVIVKSLSIEELRAITDLALEEGR
jgi:hypothetical protein